MSDQLTDLMYRCSPRKAQQLIGEIIEANEVPFLRSSPGLGKSAIMQTIADKYGLQLKDHRMASSEPTDMNGMPKTFEKHAEFLPFEHMFPLERTPLPQGKDGWLLFLDEFNSSHKQVQAASYKLILDRAVGQYRLSQNLRIALAGNLDTDGALTNTISTALESRVITIEMTVKGYEKEWLEDVAIPRGYDARLIAFLSNHPSKLMDFTPNHDGYSYSCPRTWSKLNNLIDGREVTVDRQVMYGGTISRGTAAEFVQFCSLFEHRISIERIMDDPEGCEVPRDPAIRWATVSSMRDNVTKDSFPSLCLYANRFPLDFRVLFYRGVLAVHQAFHTHPSFIKAATELKDYLNGKTRK